MEYGIDPKDDAVLLAAMRKDNREAYNSLFKRYYPVLCSYCYRFVSIHEAEDIVQEIMIWLWENRKNEIIRTSLKSYLFKMVYNRALNHIKQNEVKVRVEQFFQEKIESDNIYSDNTAHEEIINSTNKAIERLPETYRESFVMNRFKDMSYKEIAEHLQVSPKTVDYRIQQSLKLLREWLKEYIS